MNEKEVSAPVVTHLEAMTSIDSTDPKVRDVTNLDAAARFIVEHGETATEITAEESAAVRRKVGCSSRPRVAVTDTDRLTNVSCRSWLLCISTSSSIKALFPFLLCSTFRKTQAYSELDSTFVLLTGSGTQFAWLSTIVYIGALIGQPRMSRSTFTPSLTPSQWRSTLLPACRSATTSLQTTLRGPSACCA